MDADTPILALAAAATLFAFAVIGSSLVESATQTRISLLDRLKMPRVPQLPTWWASLWLLFVMSLVGIVQIAMVSAVVGPERAPLTRLICALETLALLTWVIYVIRLVDDRRKRDRW